MQRRTLFLIDGMSCAYRAFYAIPELRNSSGEPTNAVYGFTSMLLKILRERKPDALAVAFDSPAPTFRHERFDAYKAHRKPMPEDLERQLPLLRELVEAYRFTVLRKDGVEADDLMASMAVSASRAGYDVYCVTSDKDMLQVVGDHVSVVRPDGSAAYDREAVVRRYGVGPEKVVDVLALAGDASDNVPGIPGIGEKTAVELIKEFGDLEGVLRNVERVKGDKRRESLRRFADQARLSRELVTLKKDIPLEVGPDGCAVKEPDRSRMADLFRRLEFRKLQAEVAESGGADGHAYRCVSERAAVAGLAVQLGNQRQVSVRLEAGGEGGPSAELLGAAFSWRQGAASYVPASEGDSLGNLLAVFRNEAVEKVGHDMKRDLLILRRRGVALSGKSFDTMIAAYLLNPARAGYGLADLALDYLNMRITTVAEMTGTRTKRISAGALPLSMVCACACESADVALRLRGLMGPRLESEGMQELFREVEMPLVEVLADMEAVGVRIDTDLLGRLSAELDTMLRVLEEGIAAMAGERFNINSPMQLGRILFEKLKLPASRKTTRGYSTDYEVLAGLSKLHSLPGKLLEYRQLSKLKSTYVDALPRMVDPDTGRVHTSFDQTGTVTGRISSRDPNLQNIPVRMELGRRIREAFIPGSDRMVLLSADYSQIDLRILASLSGDGELLGSFARGEDIHAQTAAALFGVAPGQVTPELRRRAKTINFGIVYGMSAYGLSRDLQIEPAEAQGIIDRYFEHYRGVRTYIERSLAEAAARGYVATILNRRRPVPELNSRSSLTRELGRRIAINTPIQGSSSDVIKIAMREIGKELRTGRWRAAMLIQIHDELLFEVERRQAREFGGFVSKAMENAWRFQVPLTVNVKTGENWGEL